MNKSANMFNDITKVISILTNIVEESNSSASDKEDSKTRLEFILFFNLPIDNVYRKIRRFCEAAWRRSRRKSRTILIPSKPSALTYRFLSGNQYIDNVYILIRN